MTPTFATPFFLSFLLLSLAGCADPDARDPTASACAKLPAEFIVDEVHETSLLVDGGSLWLHTTKATILLRVDGACTMIAVDDVAPGDRVGHNAGEIATSYPAQAWPTTIVIERA